jgi:integrase
VASIFKRGGVWYLSYYVGGERVKKAVGKSKKIAELALADIELKLAKKEIGLPVEQDKPKEKSLEEFFNEYLSYSRTNHSKSTTKRYRGIIANFTAFLRFYPGIKTLSQLSPNLFEQYKTYRRNGGNRDNNDNGEEEEENGLRAAKTNTVNMEIQTLRTIFKIAIQWGYLEKNPTEGIKYLKVTDAKAPRFLTKEEIKTLLENCGEELYPIFLTFLYTGLRKGELINLTWDDVDFKRKKIKVKAKEDWQPKTSEREIPMHEEVQKVLNLLKENNSVKSKYVFCAPDGGKCKLKLRERLMQVTKKCGLPDVTKIHSLRHTFASHLVMSGVDLPTVAKLMGHADISTTMMYAHLAPDHLSGAVEKLKLM